ncbi:MAG: aminotransferase class I/II-fold pyridoxal phosphate-dependent enzyme [Salinivirgaceae bacterium]|nr:aminotransferase class I/II-fold pyridoxal phosphate-dependent enzyme [Salinivirgaceae bacterium]
MLKNLFSKLPNQGKTIFAIMSELANQYKAIDLSRGFPDFDVNEELVKLYCKFLKKGYNQYAPVNGILELREKIAEKTEAAYQSTYNPDTEITITGGATEAIFAAITTFVRENDEVIIFEPAYDLYTPAVKVNGGIPVYIEMTPPHYSFNWDQVQKSITANTRMIIINSPHNPTGNVLSAWDIERLKKLVNGTNILILSDEVYENILFDGFEHESIILHPELKTRSIIVNSFGKTFHATGWRMGYILAQKELMNEFRKVHQYSMYTVNTPAQYALSEYMTNYKNYHELVDFFQQKRDLFTNLLSGSKLEIIKTKGTYFQNVCYKQLSEEGDFEFASRLVREYKIASIPVSYFYKGKNDYKILRFCFAKNDETLKRGAEILCALK